MRSHRHTNCVLTRHRARQHAWWLRLGLLTIETRFRRLRAAGRERPEAALRQLIADTADLLQAIGELLGQARVTLLPQSPDQELAEAHLLAPPQALLSLAGGTDASLLQLAHLVQELREVASFTHLPSEESAARVDHIWASFYNGTPFS